MKIRILRASASDGCNSLVDGLQEEGHEVKRIKLRNSTYRGYPSHLIINWGRTSRLHIRDIHPIFNDPNSVKVAVNKRDTLRVLDRDGLGNYIPRFTTSLFGAVEFIERDCDEVYCRTMLRASQGRGIIVAKEVHELVTAPLYTAKVDVDREMRVHIFDKRVIDYAQKKRMGSARREADGRTEVPSEDIRNHSNGWIFARQGITLPAKVKEVCLRAMEILKLDFGAIDVAITPQGIPKILEVNTAPGLEGSTLIAYKNAFNRLIQEVQFCGRMCSM